MRAAIYARSSKERRDVSISSQVDDLKAFAKQSGDTIVKTFEDKAESAKSDDRPAFQEMMTLAKSKDCPFERVYCFDTSRFSRRREHAAAYKTLLKKAGIDLVFLKLPKSDSYVDTIIEGVFEVFDEFHSMKSKADGLRGMRQNAKQGYRAGGVAPFGYRLVPAYTGRNAEGAAIVKNKLEPDPDNAPVAKEYFERRALGESRASILRDFNARGIRSPRGKSWSVNSTSYMEENIDVYLGKAIWNRHGERIDGQFVGGKKYRDPSEWTVIPDSHEPLISQEIADKVSALKRSDGRGRQAGRESKYLLSEILYCSLCGQRLTGDSGFYACSGRKRLDGCKCNTAKISQSLIEREIVRVVKDEFIRPEFYSEFIGKAREQIKANKGKGKDELGCLKSDKLRAEKAKARWIDVYEQEKTGWETALERIDELKNEMENIDARVGELEAERGSGGELYYSDAFFLDLLDRFEETISAGTIYEQRSLLREVVERIELGPKKHGKGKPWERDVVISLRVASPTGVNMVTPRGHTPYGEKCSSGLIPIKESRGLRSLHKGLRLAG